MTVKWAKYHALIDYVPSLSMKRFAYSLRHSDRYQQIQEIRRGRQISDENNFAAFFRHKAIFIHIPKAAGNSIAYSVFGSNAGFPHTRIHLYRILFHEAEFESFLNSALSETHLTGSFPLTTF